MLKKKEIELKDNDALLLVDVQKDFLPGGALAVPNADKILPFLNAYIKIFSNRGLNIYLTRDWHPKDHCSFKECGGLWPKHCVQESEGAKFAEELIIPDNAIIISKATDKDKDAYSGFDNTELDSLLKSKNIERLFVGGLATDYCVKATVLDALSLGYKVFVLLDAIKAVNVNPNDEEVALLEMKDKGATFIDISSLSDDIVDSTGNC